MRKKYIYIVQYISLTLKLIALSKCSGSKYSDRRKFNGNNSREIRVIGIKRILRIY